VCVCVREREEGSVSVRRDVSEESSNMTTIFLTLYRCTLRLHLCHCQGNLNVSTLCGLWGRYKGSEQLTEIHHDKSK
jgi:hypothetical protein